LGWEGLRWQMAFLASARPWLQTPIPPKKRIQINEWIVDDITRYEWTIQ
jgi:hypothetical protein